ncbi:unnamed protein product [Cuscuta campestris]|nr:unnamed protein product [Cuscuta campestris]
MRKISVHHGRITLIIVSPTQRLGFLQHAPFSSSISPQSGSVDAKGASFACSYLINELGFDKEKALSASRLVRFKTPDKPDSVRQFLKAHGFADSQISYMVKRFPQILSCNPKKTLLPKLDFFQSAGISQEEITDLFTRAPLLFRLNVRDKLVPSFNYLKGMFPSNSETVIAMKRISLNAGNLRLNFKMLEHNTQLLRDAGVPQSNIDKLWGHSPRVLAVDNDKFLEIVEGVKAMGFNPKKVKFLLAVKAFTALSKDTWLKKIEAYNKCGFSEVEILEAFVKCPWCMMVSTEKIKALVDFLVNKMGFEKSVFLKRPLLFSYSLEKRVMPRCLVYQILVAKGLMKSGLGSLLDVSEKRFLKDYIECHKGEASELLKVYKEKRALVQ